MFTLRPTNQFKKDVKILKKRSAKHGDSIANFLEQLQPNGVEGIDKKHRPHKLIGLYNGNWEAHKA